MSLRRLRRPARESGGASARYQYVDARHNVGGPCLDGCELVSEGGERHMLRNARAALLSLLAGAFVHVDKAVARRGLDACADHVYGIVGGTAFATVENAVE